MEDIINFLKGELYSYNEKFERIKDTTLQVELKNEILIYITKIQDSLKILNTNDYVVCNKLTYLTKEIKLDTYSKNIELFICKSCGNYVCIECNKCKK